MPVHIQLECFWSSKCKILNVKRIGFYQVRAILSDMNQTVLDKGSAMLENFVTFE
jgi:hypothetical protein